MNKSKCYNLTFEHPARWIIFGPSSSGKSTFVMNFLKNHQHFYDCGFDRIVYCSDGIFPSTELSNKLGIECYDKISSHLLNSFKSNSRNLIIFDDQMHNLTNDILISDLFTKKSHHSNISVIFLTQNLFPKSKYMRDISINSNYIVLMRNPREKLQIKILLSQIRGIKGDDSLMQAYKLATEEPYSYFLLDLCQNTPEEIRFRSKIFPSDGNQIVYLLI